jgi:hypothetical protein
MATPSLLLIPDRYKSGVLYSQLPESGAVDFDVTRGSTATRVNALGLIESVASGVPRLDYTGGGCPSLLLEPQRTNLFLRSEEFDNAYWAKNNITVTANSTTAPDGTLTAEKLFATTTGSDRRTQRSDTLAAGTYTTSIFVKAAELNSIRMFAVDFSSRAVFNVALETVSGVSSGATAKIENYGNGWYRCSITIAYAGGAGVSFYLNLWDESSGSTVTAGDGVFLWGAQLETGSVATSYIPTTTATATRNADVISKTGVSGFIGQSQGSVYVEVDFQNLSLTNRRVITIRESANSNNFFQIERQSSTQVRITARLNSGTTINFLTHPNAPIAGVNKIAFAYTDGNYALALNGSVSSSTQSGMTASLDSVLLGQDGFASAGTFLNDRIRAAAIYTTRLSNSELASLTSL